MNGGGGVYGQDRDRYVLNKWEDNVANINLGTEHNEPLDYAPGLGHHHPIISTLGDPGSQLERERERVPAENLKEKVLHFMYKIECMSEIAKKNELS